MFTKGMITLAILDNARNKETGRPKAARFQNTYAGWS